MTVQALVDEKLCRRDFANDIILSSYLLSFCLLTLFLGVGPTWRLAAPASPTVLFFCMSTILKFLREVERGQKTAERQGGQVRLARDGRRPIFGRSGKNGAQTTTI